MDHNNIVRVRHFFEENGTGYLVMDYYEGMTLEAYLKQQGGKISEKLAVDILIPVLDGLREVHRRNFLHRDVKPQNIYLTTDGRIILLDFGAARQAVTAQTRSLSIVYTPGYAPYEQYLSRGNQGPWTDIYSAAATLYFMVVGKAPPEAQERVLNDTIEYPKTLSTRLHKALVPALAVKTEDRPQTVAEWQKMLWDKPSPAPNPAPKPKMKWLWGGVAVLIFMSIPVDLLRIAELEKIPGKVFQDRLKDGSLGPEMVWIPAGRFRMGDIQGGGGSNEKPVHSVSVNGFAMGKYEVTFAEYDKFAEATDRKKPYDQGWGRGNRPVINVSWHDAVAYTEWLNEQTGKKYRLPTEAEWEYAARAGTETARYWGNDPDKACGYANIADQTAKQKHFSRTIHNCTDGYVYTAPVGQFKPNAFGLFDMIGNAWEWCADSWHSNYKDAPTDGHVWNGGDESRRVQRGGSWFDYPKFARTAYRSKYTSDKRYDDFGFRVVLSTR
jgi:formylglycine-generating enzyme required for sulfatase activity